MWESYYCAHGILYVYIFRWGDDKNEVLATLSYNLNHTNVLPTEKFVPLNKARISELMCICVCRYFFFFALLSFGSLWKLNRIDLLVKSKKLSTKQALIDRYVNNQQHLPHRKIFLILFRSRYKITKVDTILICSLELITLNNSIFSKFLFFHQFFFQFSYFYSVNQFEMLKKAEIKSIETKQN